MPNPHSTLTAQIDEKLEAGSRVESSNELISADKLSIEALQSKVSELEQVLASANAANEARATFLATMSHELREPMNGVLGMSRLLRETHIDPEQRSYVEAVVDSAEALISIINDILDLSRIDAGKMETSSVDFALKPFFSRLGTLLESRAARKGIDFRIELEKGLPSLVHGDPGRLRQMLINLAGNAIKFTSEGEVVIRAGGELAEDNQIALRISVTDTGAGIPKDVQERLFSAFAQADVGVPRVYGGSGLGLMIAQRLALAMGGQISVHSDGIAGSRFDILVKLQKPVEGEDALAVQRADLVGTTLLVVDPQKRSRETIAELARLWRMHVRGATGAAEALSAIQDAVDRKEPFDFIVIDRSIEEGAGDTLGEQARSIDGMEHARMILLVASGVRGDAARAKEAGFDAYLPKPLTASTLLDCLQQLRAGPAEGGLLTIHSIGDHKLQPLNILVADDNPVNCRLAAIMLERAGHSVKVVANGAEAVDQLTNHDFDVVLMDIQMPVLNGLEATRQIRSLDNAKKASTPVIAITANAMRGDDAPCYNAGMNGYVTKPIDRASLMRAIDTALT